MPAAATPRDREAARLIVAGADAGARRTGMDRRLFLQSASGMALTLGVLNLVGCSNDQRSGPTPPSRTTSSTSSTSTSRPAGAFEVPDPEDGPACAEALAGDEFIFDVHTHHVVPDGPWRENAQRIADMIAGLVPAGCLEADPFRCLDRTAYLNDMFLASDTTVSMLSDVPNSGPLDAPVPWEEKRETRRLAEALGAPGAGRVLLHDVIAPNFGDLAMR
ncbi:MAG: hypothetical protein H0U29_03155, partial [Acidimicrobiia bacterium]|nr:hypothetical protein [Acidimicrobiia bacterium]